MPTRPPSHRPSFAPARVEARGTAAERGYDAAWRRQRVRFLAEHPVCCFVDDARHKHECAIAASIVDHVRPIRFGGAVLDEDNLRSVCGRAHDVLTANLRRTGRNELPLA